MCATIVGAGGCAARTQTGTLPGTGVGAQQHFSRQSIFQWDVRSTGIRKDGHIHTDVSDDNGLDMVKRIRKAREQKINEARQKMVQNQRDRIEREKQNVRLERQEHLQNKYYRGRLVLVLLEKLDELAMYFGESL